MLGKPIIAKIFIMCLASTSNYSDLEKCTQAGVVENGGEWHCTIGPSGKDKACTSEVWDFEELYRQHLFDYAKTNRFKLKE